MEVKPENIFTTKCIIKETDTLFLGMRINWLQNKDERDNQIVFEYDNQLITETSPKETSTDSQFNFFFFLKKTL